MGSNQDTTGFASALADIPRMKADESLRAFRQEAELSWKDFNFPWTELSQYMNSPANDILLDIAMVATSGYDCNLWALTSDLLRSGVFGHQRPGIWNYGRYEEEEDISAIAEYIRRLAHYAAERILTQVSSSTHLQAINRTKVGGWLTNQVVTDWDNYAFVDRVAEENVPAFPSVTNGEDGSTLILESGDPTESGNRTYSATHSLTSMATVSPTT